MIINIIIAYFVCWSLCFMLCLWVKRYKTYFDYVISAIVSFVWFIVLFNFIKDLTLLIRKNIKSRVNK